MEQRITPTRSTAKMTSQQLRCQTKTLAGLLQHKTHKKARQNGTYSQEAVSTKDQNNTTQCEHLMDKNVIPTRQISSLATPQHQHFNDVHTSQCSLEGSHLFGILRCHTNATKTNFWPHLNMKSKDVERRNQKKKNHKKANVQTSMKNYKPVVTNSTSTSQPKTKKNNVQTTSTKY